MALSLKGKDTGTSIGFFFIAVCLYNTFCVPPAFLSYVRKGENLTRFPGVCSLNINSGRDGGAAETRVGVPGYDVQTQLILFGSRRLICILPISCFEGCVEGLLLYSVLSVLYVIIFSHQCYIGANRLFPPNMEFTPGE